MINDNERNNKVAYSKSMFHVQAQCSKFMEHNIEE